MDTVTRDTISYPKLLIAQEHAYIKKQTSPIPSVSGVCAFI